jgi:UPF0716 protein FxsA
MPLLALIAVPVVEVIAFVEVAFAIGWPLALLLLLGISALGVQLLRAQGRAAVERASLAVAERRASADAALDGALTLLGAALLALPGFVTDAFGLLLLITPTRTLVRRRLSRHYAARLMAFLARPVRFASGERVRREADVDSTAIEDDLDQLGR